MIHRHIVIVVLSRVRNVGKVEYQKYQALLASNFFPYKSSYRFRYLDCCQILYSNATDLKLDIST